MENQIVEYNITDAAIAKMEKDYMSLVVSGLDDKDGLKAVHNARMIVKGVRVDVEKRRKQLKADALAWGKKVDSEAKRIFEKIEPIETHLTTEEEKVTKELERIRAEKERQMQEAAQARCDAMAKLGVSLPYAQAINLDDASFAPILAEAQARYAAEQARIAEEQRIAVEKAEAERKAREEEAARLATERAEINRLRAEEAAKLKAEDDRMRAEREKIEAERREIEKWRVEKEHQAAVEKAKKEAAEKAIREKEEADRKQKEEVARQEALRPDKEKLVAFAGSVVALVEPELKSETAQAILSEAMKRLAAVNRYINKASAEL